MADEKDGWVGALGKGAAGAVAGAGALWLIGWLSPLWSFVHHASTSLWTHLMAQSQWPNWLAYMVSLTAAFCCLTWALRHWNSRKASTLRFSQFSFMGVMWRWPGTSGLPASVKPYCLRCDTQLVYETRWQHIAAGKLVPEAVALHCESCVTEPVHQAGDFEYLKQRVIREIDRLIRSGEWKRHVPD